VTMLVVELARVGELPAGARRRAGRAGPIAGGARVAAVVGLAGVGELPASARHRAGRARSAAGGAPVRQVTVLVVELD
jgi:hypothetical protein